MRWFKGVLFSLCLVTGFGVMLGADPSASQSSPELIAQGRELFNKKEGLKIKFACILCHKQEKAIKKSDIQRIGDKLPAVINQYITEKSKGPALAPESPEMKALIAYIKEEHSK